MRAAVLQTASPPGVHRHSMAHGEVAGQAVAMRVNWGHPRRRCAPGVLQHRRHHWVRCRPGQPMLANAGRGAVAPAFVCLCHSVRSRAGQLGHAARICRVPWMMRLGCPPNQSVGVSQVRETVPWMMLLCLQDRAALPGGSCDSAGGDVANRAPATAARRGKFHAAR
jgi:hypothetical protein